MMANLDGVAKLVPSEPIWSQHGAHDRHLKSAQIGRIAGSTAVHQLSIGAILPDSIKVCHYSYHSPLPIAAEAWPNVAWTRELSAPRLDEPGSRCDIGQFRNEEALGSLALHGFTTPIIALGGGHVGMTRQALHGRHSVGVCYVGQPIVAWHMGCMSELMDERAMRGPATGRYASFHCTPG